MRGREVILPAAFTLPGRDPAADFAPMVVIYRTVTTNL